MGQQARCFDSVIADPLVMFAKFDSINASFAVPAIRSGCPVLSISSFTFLKCLKFTLFNTLCDKYEMTNMCSMANTAGHAACWTSEANISIIKLCFLPIENIILLLL